MAKTAPTTFYYFSFPNGEGELLEAMKILVTNHITFSYSKHRNDICIDTDDGYDIEEIRNDLFSHLTYKYEEEGLPF